MATLKEILSSYPKSLAFITTAQRMHAQYGGIQMQITEIEGLTVYVSVSQRRRMENLLTNEELISRVKEAFDQPLLIAGYRIAATAMA